MIQSMLTTTDNPFDPFDRFEDWRLFDETKGYNTLNYLARIAFTSDELTAEDESLANEHAIDEIVQYNILGIYRKLSRDIPVDVLEEPTLNLDN